MCDPWRRGDVSGTLSRNMKNRSDWRLLLCISRGVCLLFPFLSSKIWLYFVKRLSPFSNGGTLSDSYGSRAVVTSTFAADVSGVTAKPFKCKEDSVPLSGINTPLIWTDNLWLPSAFWWYQSPEGNTRVRTARHKQMRMNGGGEYVCAGDK